MTDRSPAGRPAQTAGLSPVALVRRFRRRVRPPDSDPWKRVRLGMAIFMMVVAVGVIGYRMLGLSMFDALYQTAITVTTVGFTEVGPASEIDRAYRVFTLLLVLFGVGGVLYTLGVMVEALMEGTVNDGIRLRRTQHMVNRISDHVILVGAGRVGQAIRHYIGHHHAEFVVIDRLPQPGADYPVITGEATDDETLRRAGVDRARTLITALDSDPDNLYVTLSARALNPGLFIVARTSSEGNKAKFRQAGADRVVNPLEIGGSRMGALAMNPTLAEFIDEVLPDESHGMRIGEVAIPDGSPSLDRPLGELIARETENALILAIRNDDRGYEVRPDPATVLRSGDVLVVIGDPRAVDSVRTLLST